LVSTAAAIMAASNPASAMPIPGAIAIDNTIASHIEAVQWGRRWWLPYYYYGGPSYPPVLLFTPLSVLRPGYHHDHRIRWSTAFLPLGRDAFPSSRHLALVY
jgi:hypothetical protein